MLTVCFNPAFWNVRGEIIYVAPGAGYSTHFARTKGFEAALQAALAIAGKTDFNEERKIAVDLSEYEFPGKKNPFSPEERREGTGESNDALGQFHRGMPA